MADEFLEGYGGQTTDQLLALDQQYRIDSLVLAFEQAIQGKAGPLTREESYVLAVEALEREVNNGGYSQFFGNSSGEFAPIIEEALRAIGCPKTADITRDAVAALRVDDISSPDAVAAAAYSGGAAIEKALAACDDRYYANDEPIADRLFQWIGANRDRVRVGG